jgi:hypothetical protein
MIKAVYKYTDIRIVPLISENDKIADKVKSSALNSASEDFKKSMNNVSKSISKYKISGVNITTGICMSEDDYNMELGIVDIESLNNGGEVISLYGINNGNVMLTLDSLDNIRNKNVVLDIKGLNMNLQSLNVIEYMVSMMEQPYGNGFDIIYAGEKVAYISNLGKKLIYDSHTIDNIIDRLEYFVENENKKYRPDISNMNILIGTMVDLLIIKTAYGYKKEFRLSVDTYIYLKGLMLKEPSEVHDIMSLLKILKCRIREDSVKDSIVYTEEYNKLIAKEVRLLEVYRDDS